jgi:hypothetical protein
VKINDKHIGVIVKQMLQKVRIFDPGQTPMLEGEHVDRSTFRENNEEAKKDNVIIGHINPADTNLYRKSDVDVESETFPEPEPLLASEPTFAPFLPGALREPVAFSLGEDTKGVR